jgi:protease-4
MLGIPLRLCLNVILAVGTLLMDAFLLLRRRPRWVEVLLEGEIPERQRSSGRGILGALRSRRGGMSIARLQKQLEPALREKTIDGVLVVVRNLEGGWAEVGALRTALAAVRKNGKRLVVHLSSPSLRDYYVASVADEVVADESGPLALTGIMAEATFYGATLERIGVKAEVIQREEYKTFAETFTRSSMSEAHKEVLDRLLDVISDEVTAAVAEGRRMSIEKARELLEGGPYTAAAAQAAGAIDSGAYLQDLRERLAGAVALAVPAATTPAGKARDREGQKSRERGREAERAEQLTARRVVPLGSYLRTRVRLPKWIPLWGRRRWVAVVPVHGTIVPGEGLPRLGFESVCGSRSVARTLMAVRRDPGVAAVVLHVNSRGGSASASDLIWREAIRLGERKPLVAYFGDAAASGGYYIGVAARTIVAQPLTLTGSIGVVGGKLTLAGLYDKLGIGKEVLTRGPAAAMLSPSQSLDPEQRRRLEQEIDATYQQFLDRVARGRGLSLDDTRARAKGRVYSGRDALERGLVDQLGTLDDAIESARGLARRVPSERLEPFDAPVRPRGGGLIGRLFESALGRVGQGSLRRLAEALTVAESLSRERVLLVAPDI